MQTPAVAAVSAANYVSTASAGKGGPYASAPMPLNVDVVDGSLAPAGCYLSQVSGLAASYDIALGTQQPLQQQQHHQVMGVPAATKRALPQATYVWAFSQQEVCRDRAPSRQHVCVASAMDKKPFDDDFMSIVAISSSATPSHWARIWQQSCPSGRRARVCAALPFLVARAQTQPIYVDSEWDHEPVSDAVSQNSTARGGFGGIYHDLQEQQ